VYSITDIARYVNRPVIYLRGLQQRFDLEVREGSDYSEAYRTFIRTLVHLRQLGITEETLVKLWHLEKKLLQLLHVDAASSSTWYLDSCGRKNHRRRRLLLTNYDLRENIQSARLQLGINLSDHPKELFGRAEMGEDVIRVLDRYLELYRRICDDAAAESRQLSSAAGWGRTLKRE